MSENIKGKLIQDEIPTPEKPVEIKTILCNGIKIPVEFLEQNIVIVDRKKYIELQQENKRLKEENEELSEEKTSKIILLGRCRLERDKYKEVIEEVREYMKKHPCDTWYYSKKKSDKFLDIEIIRCDEELLQILDKAKEK